MLFVFKLSVGLKNDEFKRFKVNKETLGSRNLYERNFCNNDWFVYLYFFKVRGGEYKTVPSKMLSRKRYTTTAALHVKVRQPTFGAKFECQLISYVVTFDSIFNNLQQFF